MGPITGRSCEVSTLSLDATASYKIELQHCAMMVMVVMFGDERDTNAVVVAVATGHQYRYLGRYKWKRQEATNLKVHIVGDATACLPT